MKIHLLILALLLHMGIASANEPVEIKSDIQTDLEISQGYRRDSLTWNITGVNNSPNIISELKYKNISTYVTRLNASICKDDFFAKALFGYGIIISGRNRDSDYLDDNRRSEFSRSHSHVTGDYTIDAVAKCGYHFRPADKLVLSPSIGYGLYTQKLRIKHGHQDRLKNPFTDEQWGKEGKFSGLNSTYHARWYSPQLGLRAEQGIGEKVSLFGEYTFLYPLKYSANAHWNLKHRHFKHHNKAFRSYGNIGTFGGQYKLTDRLSVKAEWEYMYFFAKGGETTLHRDSPIREAKRRAWETRCSLLYAF